MVNTPWKIKGMCMNAPATKDIDLFGEFVDKILAPGGCNLIVLLIRYRFQFPSHPECATDDPLSIEDAKKLLAICRKHNIRLVPKINLMGHQSGKTRDSLDGLLKAHPQFDESPDLDKTYYSRSLCPNHPDVKPVVFDLMDDLIDAFEADAIHIGCDEVMELARCERCRDIPTYRLVADWINALDNHAREKGAETFVWGDRFIGTSETGYNNGYEASLNCTERSIDYINKDLVICDWHYGALDEYPSVDIFAKHGLKMLICPWKQEENTRKFIEYGLAHDQGHILGFLGTLWMSFGDMARYMLYGELKETDQFSVEVAEAIRYLF